ncbi:hypothetical protein [Soonwooa sp.]|uniref:hypothetical protein n=1 Tax=Soonwooa sp. TaxID=1938592 RepID=UPI0026018D35|nr:hypothetical protein [Soonwooa sp.]
MSTTKTKPFIDASLREANKELHMMDKIVIVHCRFQSVGFFEEKIRIWQSTFLYDDASSSLLSELIHCENISYYPEWTDVPPGKTFLFTLYFSGLPSDCKSFTLAEIIPEANGFFVPNIKRNKSDVYNIIID